MDWKRWFRRDEAPAPKAPGVPAVRQFSEEDIDGGITAACTGDAGLFDQYEMGITTVTKDRERFRELIARRMIGDAIADDEITDEEWERLNKAQQALAISDDYLMEIQNALIGPLLTDDIKAAMVDGRVTDDEINAIFARAARLKTELKIEGSGAIDFFRMWDYFKWENGELPDVPARVALQSGERAHWSDHATLGERRIVKTRHGYAGASLSIPIVRGVRWRVGNVKPIESANEQIVHLDEGEFVMTSKRVIFVGGRASKSFTWQSVVSVTPYSDAIEFARTTGKHQYFFLMNAEPAAVMASILMGRT